MNENLKPVVALRSLARRIAPELEASETPRQFIAGLLGLARACGRPRHLRYALRWLASLRRRSSTAPLQHHIPWLSYPAIDRLAKAANANADVFEYGAGGSTLWFAERVRHVTTVEHNRGWHAMVAEELRQTGLSNCDLMLKEATRVDSDAGARDCDYGSWKEPGSFERYVRAIDAVPDGTLDIVLIDGRSRAACLLHARRKVRVGGLIVLDDSTRERYQGAMRHLGSWPREDLCFFRPFALSPSRTTVWMRPADASR